MHAPACIVWASLTRGLLPAPPPPPADACADDPRCTDPSIGVGFGVFFNPAPGSGLLAPPTGTDGTMQACALWSQAALDGVNGAIRALDTSIDVSIISPAQTLCPTTCKSKKCVGKGGHGRRLAGQGGPGQPTTAQPKAVPTS
jgi:hypothetical protein